MISTCTKEKQANEPVCQNGMTNFSPTSPTNQSLPPLEIVRNNLRVDHREHTIFLSRERVNEGTKRMNSLRLPPHLISSILREFTGKTTAYKSCVTSYLGLPVLSKNFFGLYKIWQGRQLFGKTF